MSQKDEKKRKKQHIYRTFFEDSPTVFIKKSVFLPIMRFLLAFTLIFGYSLVVSGQSFLVDSLLKQHVSALSHDSMGGRFSGSAGMVKSASYISVEMDAMGLQPYHKHDTGRFLIYWDTVLQGKSYWGYNVAGVLPGEIMDTAIIFSAHYDHIGLQATQKALPFGAYSRRTKGDTIYNGANDNATGVAALLYLASHFTSMPPPHYTLVFVCFSGEELGMIGSDKFAAALIPEMYLAYNINLEMLGRPNGTGPFITEPDEFTDFRQRLNRILFEHDRTYRKNYFSEDPFKNQNLFKRSDNYSFYKIGIPGYTIMASDPRDRFYHHTGDQYETIDFDEMGKIVEAIKLAVKPLVSGSKTGK